MGKQPAGDQPVTSADVQPVDHAQALTDPVLDPDQGAHVVSDQLVDPDQAGQAIRDGHRVQHHVAPG